MFNQKNIVPFNIDFFLKTKSVKFCNYMLQNQKYIHRPTHTRVGHRFRKYLNFAKKKFLGDLKVGKFLDRLDLSSSEVTA